MSRREIQRVIPRKVGLLAGVAALFLVVGTAFAVHDATGPMELDGNILENTPPGDPTDWQSMFDANGDEIPAGLPVGTLDTTGVIQDFEPGETGPDDTYHEPSNKDDQAIFPGGDGIWACVSAQNPTDKTDIVNAYGAAIQGDGPPAGDGDGDTADDQLFYFGVERFDNSGDAFIGLWLFQDDVGCTADGEFQGSKQTGDILVLANFTGGGSNATIQLFRYTAGVDDAAGTFDDLVTVTGKCENTNTGDLPFPQNDICATINDTNTFVTPWAMEDKVKPGPPNPDPAKEVDPDQFVEGGVNLTDVFLGAGLPAPPCFGSFLAETRSSSSLDATLKDYALGDLNFCDANIEITPTAINRVGESHTFTVDVDQTTGSGSGPALVGDVEYTLTGDNGIEAGDIVVTGGTCINGAGVEDDLDANGQCTIIFESDVSGTVTGHATVTVNIGGTLITRETDGTAPNSGDAVKTFVDARMGIAGTDTDGIGEAHTFTVTVEKDIGDGNGFVAASGQDVNVTLANAGGATYVLNTAATTCDVVGSGQVFDHANPDTNSSGQCVVVFTSNTAGTVTGSATTTVTIGTEVMPLSTSDTGSTGSVVKTFLDGTLIFHKVDQDGAPLGGATFEVCRTHNLNTAPDPDTYVDITPDVCVSVTDNAAPDTNLADGEFLLIDLVLGTYTVRETAAPPGYTIVNPNAVSAGSHTILDTELEIETAFVNLRQFRLIVITCDDTLDTLVISEVDLDGSVLDTISASGLAAFNLANSQDLTEAQLCGIGGASYGGLSAGTYNPEVLLPK